MKKSALATLLALLLAPWAARGQVCTLTCRVDLTTRNDSGQGGAVVAYVAPTSTGTCGTITCAPASGSFFPIGTTAVTCSSTSGAVCSFNVNVVGISEQPVSFVSPTTSISAKATLGRNRVYCDVGPLDQWLFDDGERPVFGVPHPAFFAMGGTPAGGNRLAFLGHNFTVNQAQLALIDLGTSTPKINYYAMNLDIRVQGGGISGDDQGNYMAWSNGDGRLAFHRRDQIDGQFSYYTQSSSSRTTDAAWTRDGVYAVNGGTNSLGFIPYDPAAATRAVILAFKPTSAAAAPNGNLKIGDANQALVHEINAAGQEVKQYPVAGPLYGLKFLSSGWLAGVQLPRTVNFQAEASYERVSSYTLAGNANFLDYEPVAGSRPASLLFDMFDAGASRGVVTEVKIDGVPAARDVVAGRIPVDDLRTLPQAATDFPRLALLGLALLVAGGILARNPRSASVQRGLKG